MSYLVSFCHSMKIENVQNISNDSYSRYELTPSGEKQPIEKAKYLRDMEVGLSDEAQHVQPHNRLHRYLRSLHSTLQRP